VIFKIILQGRNEGGKGAKFPGRRRKVPTMSQVLFSIQYIRFRKTSGSNMGAPKFLPWAPSNLVTPLHTS